MSTIITLRLESLEKEIFPLVRVNLGSHKSNNNLETEQMDTIKSNEEIQEVKHNI